MAGHKPVNGETVALKKRKRDKTDDERRSRKKHRSKSRGQVEASATTDAAPEENGISHKGGKKVVTEKALAKENSLDAEKSKKLQKQAALWTLSNPVGGRMLNIDPVFSVDERHIMIAYNTTIQIISAADSLLVRRIPLDCFQDHNKGIVSMSLSKSNADYLWVASSDGRIWHLNWTTGCGHTNPFTISAKKVIHVTVDLIQLNEQPEDVLFVLEKETKASAQIVAYDHKALKTQAGKKLRSCRGRPQALQTAAGGRVLLVVGGTTITTGRARKRAKKGGLEQLEYDFCAFEANDAIACFDIRAPPPKKRETKDAHSTVDLVVGCWHGAISIYRDLLSQRLSEKKPFSQSTFRPQILHWHRTCVHSVKWSSDGNYLISGGEENTLVLWQMDTGKLDFLPHLSACVENIVVSPSGSSYAVHLDDNSTMVLSTAEMQPTTYVSGIQTLVFEHPDSMQKGVHKAWKRIEDISMPMAAASCPTNPSQFLLCVGNGQQASRGEEALSTPLVQAFDVSTFQSIAKYAFARTVPTANNTSHEGHPISDPRISHLKYSHDGKWLASIDEWCPPARDVDPVVDSEHSVVEACQERTEIHLQFWAVVDDFAVPPELVTRVNEPHRTNKPEKMFDLASDPRSCRFATIGGDGRVRLWTPKPLKKGGLAARGPEGQELTAWSCSSAMELGNTVLQEEVLEDRLVPRSGALAFSEDGSVLFAALGGPAEAVLHVINVATGEVLHRLSGLFKGAVRGLEALASCLIMLSEEVNVYDIVSDELKYGFTLNESLWPGFPMTQLTVNHQSQSFAFAVPLPAANSDKLGPGTRTELTVFTVEDSQPQLVQIVPCLVISVLPEMTSTGFIVLDAAAQIYSVTEGAETPPLMKPLADIGLNKNTGEVKNTGETTIDLLQASAEEDGAASDEDMADLEEDQDETMDGDDDDDDDIHTAVVAPQRLADIFEAGPAFAMPPIEDLFYQVSTLYSAKPLDHVVVTS